MDHYTGSVEIYKSLYGEEAPLPDDVENALTKDGWVIIHEFNLLCYGGGYLMVNFKQHLTPEQRSILRPYFEKNQNDFFSFSKYELRREFGMDEDDEEWA